MTQSIAMLIEASGIQKYIFGSNELIQNIGASELVTQATTDWLFDDQDGLLPRPHNARLAPPGGASRWQLGNESLADGLAAEIVYAGGGNALILFAVESAAKELTFQLTKKVLQDAPGLRLEVAQRPLVSGQLHQTVLALRDEIAGQKRAPTRSAALLGLGVTAACNFTDSPAITIDEDNRYVSAEVRAKQVIGKSTGAANDRLLEYLGDVRHDEFEFVFDFNQLGIRNESSYLAIVHTDGNRMGERIGNYAESHAGDDNAYIKALREFSIRVQEATHAALVSTVGLMLASDNMILDTKERQGRWRNKVGGQVPVPLDNDGKERLPFRPIVFGGDDVTFVCEGRLGLPLAAHYLSRLAEETLPDGDPLFARAGIAIVKTHYPFARAYSLAEKLSDSAKMFIQETDRKTRRIAAMDWHFAVTGLVQPLKDLRRREYTVADGSLLMRPLRVEPVDANEWRSWDVFSAIMEEFISSNGSWSDRRNKLKALREALRVGPEAVQLLLRNLPDNQQLPLPSALVSAGDAAATGWQGSTCLYFDAVEALDFYVPLKEV